MYGIGFNKKKISICCGPWATASSMPSTSVSCVRDPVLPFDVENLVQAAEVETV